jgi:hypothetical protein
MKNKNNKVYLNICSVKDCNNIKVSMMDDGDWEYDRCGVGEYKGKVFMVDLDEGEEYRELGFVKEGLNIDDVLNIGVECGIFREIDWGYDEDDKYRVCLGCDEDGFVKFKERVGVEVGW